MKKKKNKKKKHEKTMQKLGPRMKESIEKESKALEEQEEQKKKR